MFELEELSQKIISFIFKSSDTNELTRAKAEYGLSLLLGIFIELSVCLLIAAALDIFLPTLLLMISSLFFRVVIGGSHCSSYRRCLLFTVIFYIFFALLAQHFYLLLPNGLLYVLCLIMLSVIFSAIRKKSPFINKFLIIAGFIIIFLWHFHISANYLFIINLGFLLQTFMGTNIGNKVIKTTDIWMKDIGI